MASGILPPLAAWSVRHIILLHNGIDSLGPAARGAAAGRSDEGQGLNAILAATEGFDPGHDGIDEVRRAAAPRGRVRPAVLRREADDLP